jgi:hypothetical protein
LIPSVSVMQMAGASYVLSWSCLAHESIDAHIGAHAFVTHRADITVMQGHACPAFRILHCVYAFITQPQAASYDGVNECMHAGITYYGGVPPSSHTVPPHPHPQNNGANSGAHNRSSIHMNLAPAERPHDPSNMHVTGPSMNNGGVANSKDKDYLDESGARKVKIGETQQHHARAGVSGAPTQKRSVEEWRDRFLAEVVAAYTKHESCSCAYVHVCASKD